MNDELRNFIGDLVELLKEKYNESLGGKVGENVEEEYFRHGLNFAYYDILDLIESQLESFGFRDHFPNKIAPNLGEKAEK